MGGQQLEGLLGAGDRGLPHQADQGFEGGTAGDGLGMDVAVAHKEQLLGDNHLSRRGEVLALGDLREGLAGDEELDALRVGAAHDVREDRPVAQDDLQVERHGRRNPVSTQREHDLHRALHGEPAA